MPPSKRRKIAPAETNSADWDAVFDPITLRRHSYTVAWICALHIELAAGQAMLDEVHDELPGCAADDNTYILGTVSGHNVVIACLPTNQYGTVNATNVITNMKRTFPSIRAGLMVGIGGGAPSMADIRLGDVVVGVRVMQSDLGKLVTGGRIERTAVPRIPQQQLGTVVSTLRSNHEMRPSRIPAIIRERMKDNPSYGFPASPDWLFEASYNHDQPIPDCEGCDSSRLVPRCTWSTEDPVIHYGGIASGNQVVRDGVERDKIAQEINVLCFEMEAAGLMDSLPCLPIRGICDYSDSHKNKKWQRYAAAAAAAYARELLHVFPKEEKSLYSLHYDNDLSRTIHQQRLLSSLRFEQLHSRREAIAGTHSRTCEWFLGHQIYKTWLSPSKMGEHNGFLWISGKPGAGKSTLMKYLYSKSKGLGDNKSLVASFFFNARGRHVEKSILGMYRSLIVQLLDGFQDLQKLLDNSEFDSFLVEGWPLDQLKRLFQRAVSRLGTRSFTCFIDALDECNELDILDMVQFFEEMAENAVASGLSFRICFSSRHYPYIDIRRALRLTLEDQKGHDEDLANYVEGRLRIKGPALEELRCEILAKAAGVFLWVVLVVGILNTEERRGRLGMKRRLTELPGSLSHLFKDMLLRDNDNMEDLLLCILWTLYPQRPLGPEEYYHALWIGLSQKKLVDPNIPDITDLHSIERYIVSSSKGLAELTKYAPRKVQFIHESVRDFLLKDKGILELWPDLGQNWEESAHERLKQCCSDYLKHFAIHQNNYDPEFNYADYVLLQYSSLNLLYHANVAANSIPQNTFLSRFSLSEWIMARSYSGGHLGSDEYNSETNILYILAHQGLANLVSTRLQDFPRLEIYGMQYRYPLFAALANEYKKTVEAMISSPCVIDASEIAESLTYGQEFINKSGSLNLLSWAAFEGQTDIAQLLLQRGCLVDDRDGGNFTPLERALEQNHIKTAELLLKHGADPQKCSLASVIKIGNIKSVQFLLDNGLDPNIMGARDDDLPLTTAIWNGQDKVIKMLLERGASPDTPGRFDRTPRSEAKQLNLVDVLQTFGEEGKGLNLSTLNI
ncbi:unnamed protein product [Clonostachys solani]|uniref:Nucleoside phosphorylase domain-containing protein n=1 Tax=Clonostachys solani TaxID=160281 RepID=A0A9N9Z183_9HYPO|nr:unnamed protein product [Clonostachys solani]